MQKNLFKDNKSAPNKSSPNAMYKTSNGSAKGKGLSKLKEDKTQYSGHRARLKQRFLNSNGVNMPDYEILEMILFQCFSRRDTKPIAKDLLKNFGTIGRVLTASPEELKASGDYVSDSLITALKLTHKAASLIQKEEIKGNVILDSWIALIEYLRLEMGYNKVEQFRVLYLDTKNNLVADVIQQEGTLNYTSIYPREVIKKALEISAASIILVHNHPSGDCTPSNADVELTESIQRAVEAVEITLHDHVIISKADHFSLKANGLI